VGCRVLTNHHAFLQHAALAVAVVVYKQGHALLTGFSAGAVFAAALLHLLFVTLLLAPASCGSTAVGEAGCCSASEPEAASSA
jgi:hypothetical protein